MSRPKVWNKADVYPRDAVYVGRPSKWGNPYSHKPTSIGHIIKVKTREEAIARWVAGLTSETVDAIRRELKGKHLVCWCAPKACHADLLLEIANG